MNAVNVATFLEIARLGSFRAAAARLNVGQSTVSARIAALEAHLGVDLFDRSHYRATLSDAGRRLLEPASEVVAALGRAETAVSDDAALTRELRIGAVEIIAMSWLGVFVHALLERYRSVRPRIVVRPTADLLGLLERDELDIVLVPEPTLRRPVGEAVSAVPLGEVEWALAVAEGSGSCRAWTPDMLGRMRLATLGHGSLVGPALHQWFRDAGLQPRAPITCDAVAPLVSIIRSGGAVGLLPRSLEGSTVSGLRLEPLSPPLPRFRYAAIVSVTSDRLASEASQMAAACSSFTSSN